MPSITFSVTIQGSEEKLATLRTAAVKKYQRGEGQTDKQAVEAAWRRELRAVYFEYVGVEADKAAIEAAQNDLT